MEFCQVSNFGPLELIGAGQFGCVFKATHLPTQQQIAVKKTLCTRRRYNNICKYWKFVLDPNGHQQEGREHVINFLGVLYFDSDCWLCMELMDLSLDKLITLVFSVTGEFIPEFAIAQVARAMVLALQFIENNFFTKPSCRKLMKKATTTTSAVVPFADIKTSNVLLKRSGQIKLCNLGMCRRLAAPTTTCLDGKWFNYISPERICPGFDGDGETASNKADVWAIGISLYECSTGVLPFQELQEAFQVVTAIVNAPAPQLEPTPGRYSAHLASFVNACLRKDARERPDYQSLLRQEFIKSASERENITRMANYFSKTIDLYEIMNSR